MQLQINTISKLLDQSFKEDYGIRGDITTDAVVDRDKKINFAINARQDMILCGMSIAEYYFNNYSTIEYQSYYKDGDQVKKSMTLVSGYGYAQEILLIERIILNFMQHLSGIATLTNSYVKKVQSTKARICDTRKTIPMLRQLQKYAVSCGGGYNHRLTLDSAIMIKDNHIAICGGIKQALKLAKEKNPHYTKIEVECDTMEQVQEALSANVDIIMLDNMTIEQINMAVKIIGNSAIIEASGNVSLDNVAAIAKTGVDIISVGKITHSAPSVDIGLDIT
ncbi:MAG: carboxylating nicotinate-nucleotide diphosphorylase [Rickettsiales bacterium]|nr:MAG: carboxylating nicotinate-nucleotide diphosphorylase [Rickettsiales bacterium]